MRGLDYYTRTLFEIKGATEKLGAGSTLVGGGRYDDMVADLGGPQVPAHRLRGRSRAPAHRERGHRPVERRRRPRRAARRPPRWVPALVLARELRRAGVRCEVDTRGTSLKSQLRRANALGARVVLILGESELAENVVQVKDLDARTQDRLPRAVAVRFVTDRLATPPGVPVEVPPEADKEQA